MTAEIQGYKNAPETIKTAILRAQYAAAKSANIQQAYGCATNKTSADMLSQALRGAASH